ncbi:hypothetical protein [Paraburkholderia sp. SIMBA_054]|uniref:hypothetical protein n=1 Tax=Paraburkholderia sp. SIMBA_054 TaxID=3085795 RepID=UPI00397A67A7
MRPVFGQKLIKTAARNSRRPYEVHRHGWGKRPGRFMPFALVSLMFWSLIARIALREGRIVVITGAEATGHGMLTSLLPGNVFGGPELNEQPHARLFEIVPEKGHFTIDGPKDLPDGQFWELLEYCADAERSFTVTAMDAEWLMTEMKRYSRLPGARRIFWLSLV